MTFDADRTRETDTHGETTSTALADVCQAMQELTTIAEALVRHADGSGKPVALEYADLFEDLANKHLDIVEVISSAQRRQRN